MALMPSCYDVSHVVTGKQYCYMATKLMVNDNTTWRTSGLPGAIDCLYSYEGDSIYNEIALITPPTHGLELYTILGKKSNGPPAVNFPNSRTAG